MPTDVVKSAGRVFEILEYLDSIQRPAGLSELVAHFGYPQSSIASLLKTLVTLGYLHHDRSARSYAPTTRLARLGDWVMTSLLDDEPAIQLVSHLRRATGETVVLGVRNDLAAQYILVRLSDNPLSFVTRTGVLRPLCHSGMGWMLLTTQVDASILKLARLHNLSVEKTQAKVKPDEVLDRVQQARRDGYAFSRDIVTRGAGMIAVLLPQTGHDPQRAVGVAGPTERLVEKQVLILRAIRNGLALFYGQRTAVPRARKKVTAVDPG
jgi:DNA-binding IclR family transcriptional regulator